MLKAKENGVTLGTKHSFYDYGLIMTSKYISDPEPQTKTVSVPGRNGLIDLTEVVSKTVKYNPRQIKLTFLTEATPLEWSKLISDLQSEFQGQKIKFIFDDDLAFYWLGRPTIELTNSGRIATITIEALVDPYKYSVITSAEDWLWDPFDFEYGVINETADMVVDGTLSYTLLTMQKWENPIIISNSAMTVEVDGHTYNIKEGSQVLYEVILTKGEHTFTFTGNGTVTINYVGGML